MNKTKIYVLATTKPSLNLATEYFIFNNCNSDAIILWRNNNCVVLGCNQNAYKELNLSYIKEHKIDVVRRISGGGAVFHDLGNINFTYISKQKDELNFEKFTQPVVEMLNQIGVNAKFSGRNDLVVEQKKISGSAKYVSENKVLHHGTLMYDVCSNHLDKCLNVHADKIKSKGITSVKSRVTNIKKHLHSKLEINEFMTLLQNKFCSSNNTIVTTLNEEQLYKIKRIEQEKFANKNWIYGTNYDYEFIKEKYFVNVGLIEIFINVNQNQHINDFIIKGDFFAKKNINEFTAQFINKSFSYENIKQILWAIEDFNDYFMNLEKNQLLKFLFE